MKEERTESFETNKTIALKEGNMVRKAKTLSGIDDLKLSKSTQGVIKRRMVSPDEAVLHGRKIHLRLTDRGSLTNKAKWEQELVVALDAAGLIRHDINLGTYRVWGLYSAILASDPTGFIRRDEFTNEDYERIIPVSDADYSKVKEALSSLTETEKDVIERRFGLCAIRPASLENIGRIYSVTTERVRQIEAKALRKLRHQNRLSMLPPLFGFIPPEDPKAMLAEQISVGPAAPKTSIDSLELTVRTYHCLKRKGITTVGDILPLSREDLKGIRNLGSKSLEEVVEKIRQIGYPEFCAE